LEAEISEKVLEIAEADSYFSFVYLLSHMKENFANSFKGIEKNFVEIE